MKKFVLLSFLLSAAMTMIFAQNGAIKGQIYSLEKVDTFEIQKPLEYAHVYVIYAGVKIGGVTDANGNFTIKPLSPGIYNLVIKHVAIDSITLNRIQVTGTKTTYIPTQFITAGITLYTDPITPGSTLRTDAPSLVEMSRDELINLPDISNINVALVAIGAGVSLVGRSNEVTFRGARVGDALYIVDDVAQRSTDVDIPSGSIGSIQMFLGGVPSKYGDFMGGVVIIETRSYFEWLNEQYVKELVIEDSYKKPSDS